MRTSNLVRAGVIAAAAVAGQRYAAGAACMHRYGYRP
jgi:hypothetical protein